MPAYYYKVGREDGSILTKEAEADSEEVLRRELEEQGFLVLEVKKQGALGISFGGKRKKQTGEDFLVFNQEFLVLLRAGLPIVQSLDILLERATHPAFNEALVDVKTEVRGGKALSDAMSRHTGFFPELYCNSLRAGEKTGNLPDVLERYIKYSKKMLAIKRQVITALTYPTFLVGATVLLLIVLLVYVVPTFSQIYSDFKTGLPLPTVMLMNTTTFLKQYFLVFAGCVAALVFAFRAWYKTEGGRKRVDANILRVPLVGSLVVGYQVSSITRTLATILSGGIPIIQALEMVARSITNREISDKLYDVQERVRQGTSLADAIEKTEIMPPMTIRMIEVGEATGALEIMLDDISNFYEDEVNVKVQRLTNLIEPIIMLTMGLVVGSIVIVMYLPIFELAGAVK
jgi:type IV pilus assembly protein PilC